MVKGEIGPHWGGRRKARELGWIGMCRSKTGKGEKGSQEAVACLWKCGQDNYPAAWEPLAQGARLEAVTAHTDVAARQQTIGMEGHGLWPSVCLFRAPMFISGGWACTFLSSAL